MRQTRVTRRPESAADSTRRLLELNRLLDSVERAHPEISAPLRLTLTRAHRDHQIGWIDEHRFRDVLDDLIRHASPGPTGRSMPA